MDPVTLIGLAASIVQLINATAQSIQYANDVRKAPKEVTDFAQESSNILSLLWRMRSRVEAVESQQDPWFVGVAPLGRKNGVLEQLKTALEQLVDKLAGAHKIGRRILWTIDKQEMLKILARIERLKTLINLALQDSLSDLSRIIASNTARLPKLGEDISSIRKTIEDQESRALDEHDRRIIGWLSPLNFSALQIETLEKREVGTGNWILNDSNFADWVRSAGGILCCQGIPGSGKTILASVAIDFLQRTFAGSEDVRVACIYFRYSERDSQGPADLIAGLWRQIIDFGKPLTKDTKEIYATNLNQGTRPTLDAFFALLQAEVKSRAKVYVVLDALDEYTTEGGARSTLLEKLRLLKPSPNIMITSRAFDDDIRYTHRLQISATQEDMGKYIAGRIKREERLRRHVARDQELAKLMSGIIIDRAKDMFLMAALHMDSLVSKPNPRAVRNALESLPRGLDDTYQKVLHRIDSQNEDDRELAQKVLSWLCFAKRPLTLEELQHALSIESDEAKFDPQSITEQDLLISVCAGLLIVDPESRLVRLVHYTAQEFFERIRANRFPNAERDIAITCLRYLSFDAFAGYCSSRQVVEERMQKYPFLAFAASSWGYHLRGQLESVLCGRIMAFLENKSSLSCASQVLVLLVCGWIVDQKVPEANASALNAAAYFGLNQTIALIIERSTTMPDPKAKSAYLESYDQYYGTVLHWAALGNNESSLELLLAQEGCSHIINQQNCYTNTALFEAVRNSRGEAIRKLMEHGANVFICGDAHTLPPLHQATFHGQVEDIEVLLESDEKREMLAQRAHEGITVLHSAASRNHYDATVALLDHGASLYECDMYGKTPLHVAADRGASSTATLLINRDHSLQHLGLRARNSRTAFHSSCILGHVALSDVFLQSDVGKDLLLMKTGSFVAIQLAAMNGQAQMVELLLRNYEVNTLPLPLDEDSATVLHLAVRSGDVWTVRALLNKARYAELLGCLTINGSTPLHEAASRGHVEVTEIIAQAKADLDAKDNSGRTALHYVAEKDLDAVLSVLLVGGAEPDVEDDDGQTPLSVALKHRSANAVGLLLETGATRPSLNNPALEVWAESQPWWRYFNNETNEYVRPFRPESPHDVFHAFFFLRQTPLSILPESSRAIQAILEMAEYWIASKTVHAESLPFTMHDGDSIYLRSQPIIGRNISPIQKIVFAVTSKDQGWSDNEGKGTYDGSFTWFDTARLREASTLKPLFLINNIHAGQAMKTHTMIWTPRGRLDSYHGASDAEISRWVREFRPEDRVVVVPKALYQGWTNHVERVELTIYTSCLLNAISSGTAIPARHTGISPATIPLRQTYVGGFYYWGASSAGFDHEDPALWTI